MLSATHQSQMQSQHISRRDVCPQNKNQHGCSTPNCLLPERGQLPVKGVIKSERGASCR